MGNISRVNISCIQGGLNDKEVDNVQNYYGVLIRRISDTENETFIRVVCLCFVKDRRHGVSTTG